ncbi:PRELI domain-containing protein 2-like [Orbicella faveolata]|uniref:PRELI domain-containing protein 2-like n=1 Tax=Orbicella faveolata TaxID=48498 RepID=UPI0009E468FD|nr:PRELI domain-containing protein 2-like [Orbicella faveolata]
MVRYVEIDYIFKHPFEAVSRAYFQKYTCGKDTNVTSVTVLEHRTDPETGEEYLLRRGECVNVLPGLLKKVCQGFLSKTIMYTVHVQVCYRECCILPDFRDYLRKNLCLSLLDRKRVLFTRYRPFAAGVT